MAKFGPEAERRRRRPSRAWAQTIVAERLRRQCLVSRPPEKRPQALERAAVRLMVGAPRPRSRTPHAAAQPCPPKNWTCCSNWPGRSISSGGPRSLPPSRPRSRPADKPAARASCTGSVAWFNVAFSTRRCWPQLAESKLPAPFEHGAPFEQNVPFEHQRHCSPSCRTKSPVRRPTSSGDVWRRAAVRARSSLTSFRVKTSLMISRSLRASKRAKPAYPATSALGGV